MSDDFDSSMGPMLEIYIFETNQLLEQLEEILLSSEKNNKMSDEDIKEIFRIMHTIKGSAAMMRFNNIALISHAVEDLFDFIRKRPELNYNEVFDVLFAASDFIKSENVKIQNNQKADGDETTLLGSIHNLLTLFMDYAENNPSENIVPEKLITDSNFIGISEIDENDDSQKYISKVFFDEGCGMENVRAFTLVYALKPLCSELYYRPYNIEGDNSSSDYIIKNGFTVYFASQADKGEINKVFEHTVFVKSFDLIEVDDFNEEIADIKAITDNNSNNDNQNKEPSAQIKEFNNTMKNTQQSLISVNTKKLDTLLDLVGEIVIIESMVTKNPDLYGLQLENFEKVSSQLGKLIQQLQDDVMSLRMIPVSDTFQKMNRIVRDIGKKLNKEVQLFIEGEETELDKNIINHLSDPLMHLIRNSMDHGIEKTEDRIKAGKNPKGRITISANNAGGEVIIKITDDGRGLDRKEIYKKAKSRGIVKSPEKDLSDKEIFSYIFHPGFSTKEAVTEFSGRGVGLDVVKDNINKVGGEVQIESTKGKGMTVILKIPLTLAIVDSMNVSVGNTTYTIPTASIYEFYKASEEDLLQDVAGNEMIMIRGDCYPIVRLHKRFGTETDITDLCSGIMIMVQWDDKSLCLFADKLIGEQHVVTKPLPKYLTKCSVRENGISGCTILGDGNISLILDIKSIINQVI